MYRFPWYLTLVSTNHASSNPGQLARKQTSYRPKDYISRTDHFIFRVHNNVAKPSKRL